MFLYKSFYRLNELSPQFVLRNRFIGIITSLVHLSCKEAHYICTHLILRNNCANTFRLSKRLDSHTDIIIVPVALRRSAVLTMMENYSVFLSHVFT